MKREKFILQPGKICTFDANNLLKKNEITGIIMVEIVEEIPKRKLFGPRWFKVIGAGKDQYKLPEPIEVPETFLTPVGMSIIRNPANFPTVSNLDINALDYVIKSLENPADMIVINKNTISRLKALREKMRFYISFTEV